MIKVRKLIDKLESALASRLGIKKERVLEEIAVLALSNAADFGHIDENGQLHIDLSEITRDKAACISGNQSRYSGPNQ